jgi:hypothetical protein
MSKKSGGHLKAIANAAIQTAPSARVNRGRRNLFWTRDVQTLIDRWGILTLYTSDIRKAHLTGP